LKKVTENQSGLVVLGIWCFWGQLKVWGFGCGQCKTSIL